jgi:AraC-like DNA-binding protein
MFTFFDILLFLGISQGLFLAIGLSSIKNGNKKANKVLAAFLLLAVFMLIGRVSFYFRSDSLFVYKLAIFADSIIFLFGPLLYLYFNRLLFLDRENDRLPIWHFIPFFFQLSFATVVLFLSKDSFISYSQQGFFNWPFFLCEFFGLISLTWYSIRCGRALYQFYGAEQTELSYHQGVTAFLTLITAAVGTVLILWWLNFLGSQIFNEQLVPFGYNTFWIANSLLIYLVGYFSLYQPAVFRVYMPPLKKQPKTAKVRVEKEPAARIKSKLDFLMEVDQLYLKEELSLKHLAGQLNTTANDLSFVLNHYHQTTFYKFINKHRVYHFLEQVKMGKHKNQTLLALAFDSGFNSKTAFNNAFKLEFNKNPSAYIKELEAEKTPSIHL